MGENSTSDSSQGCGCLSLIATVLALWALWFGLPTPWGIFCIDLIPPAIRIEAALPPDAPDPEVDAAREETADGR